MKVKVVFYNSSHLEDQFGLIKWSKSKNIKNPVLKVEILHRDRNNKIDKIKLEESRPSLKNQFRSDFDKLDIYDRGQIWKMYLQKEVKVARTSKPDILLLDKD